MNKDKCVSKGKYLLYGNHAIAEAAIRAGCRFYAGYPITPQTELTEYLSFRMPEVMGNFVQAESELAAINMVFGASCTGVRCMTSSSSPGISLMQECISYMAACELPCVIVNIARGGPGLGNIAPAQADYFQATRGGGHGDYRCIVLAPYTIQDAIDLTYKAFDLADLYRIPVIELADGLLGQTMEPACFPFDQVNPSSLPSKSWALTGAVLRHGKHIKSLYLSAAGLEERNNILQQKYKKIIEQEVDYELFFGEDTDVLVVAYGSSARIALDAVEQLRNKSVRVTLLRPITLWPFPTKTIEQLVCKCKKVLVVEMSAGQMLEDVKLSIMDRSMNIEHILTTGGRLPTVKGIKDKVMSLAHDKS